MSGRINKGSASQGVRGSAFRGSTVALIALAYWQLFRKKRFFLADALHELFGCMYAVHFTVRPTCKFCMPRYRTGNYKCMYILLLNLHTCLVQLTIKVKYTLCTVKKPVFCYTEHPFFYSIRQREFPHNKLRAVNGVLLQLWIPII